jgi:hypothetical protein
VPRLSGARDESPLVPGTVSLRINFAAIYPTKQFRHRHQAERRENLDRVIETFERGWCGDERHEKRKASRQQRLGMSQEYLVARTPGALFEMEARIDEVHPLWIDALCEITQRGVCEIRVERNKVLLGEPLT